MDPFAHYYPDLCFALKKLGLAVADESPSRSLLLTIGPSHYLKRFNGEIHQLLRVNNYTHHHVTVSEGDNEHLDWSDFDAPPLLVDEHYLYDESAEFANAAYVFTSRFHGFVMSLLHGVPHVVPMLPTWKVMTFQMHHDMERLAMFHVHTIRHVLFGEDIPS